MPENEKEEKPMNDRSEGIIRDPVNYKGEIVSYVKDIGNGDPGYDAKVRQVLIMKQDGTEIVVLESEIMKPHKQVSLPSDGVVDRRPDQTLPQGSLDPDLPGNENPQARAAVEDKK